MREILFKAKRQNGEWREGSLLFYPDVNRAFISSGDSHSIGGTVEVDKKTVGQYTGLTDKNGKKIFEGDILRYCGVQNVVVSFENGQFVINHYAINLLCARNSESEVIGNIHDNPELLEVSSDA